MAKVAIIIFLTLSLYSGELLKKNCLNCHQKEQLPTKLIYKRYLMKYSTKKSIFNALYNYLKNPNIKNSIMPKAFFSKFPIKDRLNLDDKELNATIKEFIEEYDIKKHLILDNINDK